MFTFLKGKILLQKLRTESNWWVSTFLVIVGMRHCWKPELLTYIADFLCTQLEVATGKKEAAVCHVALDLCVKFLHHFSGFLKLLVFLYKRCRSLRRQGCEQSFTYYPPSSEFDCLKKSGSLSFYLVCETSKGRDVHLWKFIIDEVRSFSHLGNRLPESHYSSIASPRRTLVAVKDRQFQHGCTDNIPRVSEHMTCSLNQLQ